MKKILLCCSKFLEKYGNSVVCILIGINAFIVWYDIATSGLIDSCEHAPAIALGGFAFSTFFVGIYGVFRLVYQIGKNRAVKVSSP